MCDMVVVFCLGIALGIGFTLLIDEGYYYFRIRYGKYKKKNKEEGV